MSQTPEAAMLSPDRIPDLAALSAAASTDYDIVRRAIAHIRGHWRDQPEVEDIADAAGVTPTDLHHLFRRWAGLTPKAFLQALTLDHARKLLRDSASVLDATYEVGLSGPGPPARPVRHPRGDVARRMEIGRRGPDHQLRLPPLAVRHRAGDGDRARPRRPRLRGCGRRGPRRSPTCAAAGARRPMWKTPRAPRRSRSASSIRRCGGPTGRCASC